MEQAAQPACHRGPFISPGNSYLNRMEKTDQVMKVWRTFPEDFAVNIPQDSIE